MLWYVIEEHVEISGYQGLHCPNHTVPSKDMPKKEPFVLGMIDVAMLLQIVFSVYAVSPTA